MGTPIVLEYQQQSIAEVWKEDWDSPNMHSLFPKPGPKFKGKVSHVMPVTLYKQATYALTENEILSGVEDGT